MQELLLVFILLLAVLTLLSALGGSLRFQEGFFAEEAGKKQEHEAGKHEPFEWDAKTETFRAGRRQGRREGFEDEENPEGFEDAEGFRMRRAGRRERFEDEKKPAVAAPPAVDPQAEGFRGGRGGRRERFEDEQAPEGFQGAAVMEPMAANDEEGFIEPFENPAMFGGCATGTCAAF